MATAKIIEGIELTLTKREAELLEGLLVNAVSFTDNPELALVHDAIAELTGAFPEFKYNDDTGYFEEVQ